MRMPLKSWLISFLTAFCDRGMEFTRALGIDYGTARIGLAGSDDLGMMAHPLETVSATPLAEALSRIVEVVAERKVEDLVIGLPLHMNGDEGEAVKKVRGFMRKLKPLLSSHVRIHEIDERYTTVDAMAKLHEVGRNAKNTRHIIDQAAAVEILQQWLEQRDDGQNFMGEPPFSES